MSYPAPLLSLLLLLLPPLLTSLSLPSPPSSSSFLSVSTLPSLTSLAGGTPFYVYDKGRLEQAADETLAFPNAFGLTVR